MTILRSGKHLKNHQKIGIRLTNKHHMSHSTLHRLKHNKAVSTNTINDICCILNCNVQDIMRYVRSEQDQKL